MTDTKIAQTALTHYNLLNPQLTFLGKSQNTTYRVDVSTGDRFLLRLHRGIAAAGDCFQTLWQEPSIIQSELLWLNAIAHETELIIPQPVQNRLGEWVTTLTSEEGDPPISCTLLRWVPGNHLDGKPTASQIYQLGQLMARLHQQSIGWPLPTNFNRPTHGVEQVESATVQLEVLVQNGIISAEDYQVFREAATQVQKFIASLQQTPDTWGLIHADLHQGNYLLYNDEVRPIDFSRCGFGFYLYDIGESVGDIEVYLRPRFFEGYTSIRKLPEAYQSIVETFFIGATVENFAFHSTNNKEFSTRSLLILL
jgi:Ser/Thr protein kinase RdoA (MazF antagonist)